MGLAKRPGVIVVGGGLSGLTAAALLARQGLRVRVLERSGHPGGRATTQRRGGFHLNLGPHALYRKGPAATLLRELGIRWRGRTPTTSGRILDERGLHALPGGLWSFATTSLLSRSQRWALARFLFRAFQLAPARLRGLSVTQWLRGELPDERTRATAAMLVRVTTYANAPDRQCAEAALSQLVLGLRGGVTYLDGGWQTLVDGLLGRLAELGVEVTPHASVQGLGVSAGAVRGVVLDSGATLPAEGVLLAVPPAAAAALLRPHAPAAARRADQCLPVRAATLEVCLRRLPRPSRLLALGVGQPTYFSVHSAAARLAPEGGALVHAAKYLAPEDPGGEADRLLLEGMLDAMQPGWRDQVEHARFLPHLQVTGALVESQLGGMEGRPGVEVDGVEGLFLAGDWVGGRGQLLDAALASAAEAAEKLAAVIGRSSPERLLPTGWSGSMVESAASP